MRIVDGCGIKCGVLDLLVNRTEGVDDNYRVAYSAGCVDVKVVCSGAVSFAVHLRWTCWHLVRGCLCFDEMGFTVNALTSVLCLNCDWGLV